MMLVFHSFPGENGFLGKLENKKKIQIFWKNFLKITQEEKK